MHQQVRTHWDALRWLKIYGYLPEVQLKDVCKDKGKKLKGSVAVRDSLKLAQSSMYDESQMGACDGVVLDWLVYGVKAGAGDGYGVCSCLWRIEHGKLVCLVDRLCALYDGAVGGRYRKVKIGHRNVGSTADLLCYVPVRVRKPCQYDLDWL